MIAWYSAVATAIARHSVLSQGEILGTFSPLGLENRITRLGATFGFRDSRKRAILLASPESRWFR
jgi:hypothetical protein